MFLQFATIRKIVAVCLVLYMPCQVAMARQCNCTECSAKCCSGTLTGPERPMSCTVCLGRRNCNACDSNHTNKLPCKCNCHKAPLGDLPRSSQDSLSISELIEFATIFGHWQRLARWDTSCDSIDFPMLKAFWSPLDTCVLLCRFLA